MGYQAIYNTRKKELLTEYKTLFYQHSMKTVEDKRFEEEKTRIQTAMVGHEVPFELKREARELGVKKAENDKSGKKESERTNETVLN